MPVRLSFIFLLLLTCSPALKAQSSDVTDFQENHKPSLALYFYPSTLRMINLQRNAEYDEMISELKKARFLKLDSGAVTQADLTLLAEKLLKAGYEEMMLMKSADTDIRILGLEKKVPEVVVIARNGYESNLMEISGMINIAKIPKLLESFNSGGFLDVLNLNKQKNEPRPHD